MGRRANGDIADAVNPDLITRILLAGVLACLALLVVQGTRTGDAGSAPGRYELRVFSSRQVDTAVRTDTRTGQLWRLDDLRADTRWVEITGPDPAAQVESRSTAAE